MYHEHNSHTSWHKITLDRLIRCYNQSVSLLFKDVFHLPFCYILHFSIFFLFPFLFIPHQHFFSNIFFHILSLYFQFLYFCPSIVFIFLLLLPLFSFIFLFKSLPLPFFFFLYSFVKFFPFFFFFFFDLHLHFSIQYFLPSSFSMFLIFILFVFLFRGPLSVTVIITGN